MAVTVRAIGVTTGNIGRLGAFYRDALGFEPGPRHSGGDLARILGENHTEAEILPMRLGDQEIEIAAFTPQGQPYPPEIGGNDVRFQHFAVVVSSMSDAYLRLQSMGGWTPISQGGPQRLPASSGGVSAFKFRDPDGHPLELLEFTAGNVDRWRNRERNATFLGVDHTAITVTRSGQSTMFYRDLLGLSLAGTSLNRGAEQERLDSLPAPMLTVTALRSANPSSPGIELLWYSGTAMPSSPVGATDVAATRILLEVADLDVIFRQLAAYGGRSLSDIRDLGGRRALAARDPDGHILVLLAAP